MSPGQVGKAIIGTAEKRLAGRYSLTFKGQESEVDVGCCWKPHREIIIVMAEKSFSELHYE